ncbi:helix-turn-helix domain-containing protein [Levilactobacillus yonginensis]|uniref:helix-turn-helix domain-containing protein n=1 Tax=Levilactobacillus yonginensis TaxID=1054041 RepID=UPI00345C6C32
MTLGEKLKQARTTQQFTQQTVAEHVHVSRQTISSWETGNSYPDIDSLVVLSDLYEQSLDILIKGDPGLMNYLRKPAILKRLRPIHLILLTSNYLFLIIFTFFLSSGYSLWALLAVFITNTLAFLYLQKFEERLNPLPIAIQRWQAGWLPTLLCNLITTGAMIASPWWASSPTAVYNLFSTAIVGWACLACLWVMNRISQLKELEKLATKQK